MFVFVRLGSSSVWQTIVRIVLVNFRVCCTFAFLSTNKIIKDVTDATYNFEGFKHVLSDMFEFFHFKSLVNSVDDVVVCLLLLLFHLRKLLEAFLSKLKKHRL